MNKQALSERDICTKFITPALEKSGWDVLTQVREEFLLTKGRIIVRCKLHTRGQHKRADYVLFHKPNLPIAVIERELLEEFNLHTIVLLPKGVFAPYTSIVTNILFFEKGGPTQDVWFFEHPYPEGYKSYSRSKPLTIEEFDLEKDWWGGHSRKGRKTTENAWKVSAKDLAARNYNLDCKNPHEVAVEHGDPDELMVEFLDITRQLQVAQQALKTELLTALKSTDGGTV